MVPQDLLDIEDLVILGSFGGFVRDGERLYWYNSWIGDAPGENPIDTTGEAAREVANTVEVLGYTVTSIYVEHDHAQFDIEIKKEKQE